MLLWQILLLVSFVICGILTMYYCFGDTNNPFQHHFRNPTALRKLLGRKCLCFRKRRQQTQSAPSVFVISTEDNQQTSNNNNNNNTNVNMSGLHLCDLPPPSYDELFNKIRESQRYEKF